MATLLVLLEASPFGIHPASALGLCVARDLASARGATVVASCEAQNPNADAAVLREATRRGADRMIFCDARQLKSLLPAMAPKCALAPATKKSRAKLTEIGGTDLTIAWVQGPADPPGELNGTIALMAGTLPWYELQAEIIPEYPGDDQLCDLREIPIPPVPGHAPELRYVIDPELDSTKLRSELSLLGASELHPSDNASAHCIRICIGESLPDYAAEDQRWILVPGNPSLPIAGAWGEAWWVLPGKPYDAIRNLHGQIWSSHLK